MKAGFQRIKCVMGGFKGRDASGKPMSFSGVPDLTVDARIKLKARAIAVCGILRVLAVLCD